MSPAVATQSANAQAIVTPARSSWGPLSESVHLLIIQCTQFLATAVLLWILHVAWPLVKLQHSFVQWCLLLMLLAATGLIVWWMAQVTRNYVECPQQQHTVPNVVSQLNWQAAVPRSQATKRDETQVPTALSTTTLGLGERSASRRSSVSLAPPDSLTPWELDTDAAWPDVPAPDSSRVARDAYTPTTTSSTTTTFASRGKALPVLGSYPIPFPEVSLRSVFAMEAAQSPPDPIISPPSGLVSPPPVLESPEAGRSSTPTQQEAGSASGSGSPAPLPASEIEPITVTALPSGSEQEGGARSPLSPQPSGEQDTSWARPRSAAARTRAESTGLGSVEGGAGGTGLGSGVGGGGSYSRSLFLNEKLQDSVLMQLRLPLHRRNKVSYSDVPEHNGLLQILSVDDEGVNQLVLEMLLAKQYDLVTASDGFECLQYLERCVYLPDLVLMDIMLPGMSGYEVVRRIRQDYTNVQLPIIMVTAHQNERDVLRWLHAGANDFIPKPVKYQELVSRISTLMAAKRSLALEAEARSHYKLLTTMLPAHIIHKLNDGANLIAEKHEMVTLLFSDICGFTVMAGTWPTERVVLMLNEMFTAFDRLCDKHSVYKVETIGDAYMIVAGHDGAPNCTERMLDMAEAMLSTVQQLECSTEEAPIRIRIGVHSGPALSGVVGIKCPRYCFFGDTVNTASRMESHGFPMTVHCSAAVVNNLQNPPPPGRKPYEFVPCPDRLIKGKGVMKTYLLKVGEYKAALKEMEGSSDS